MDVQTEIGFEPVRLVAPDGSPTEDVRHPVDLLLPQLVSLYELMRVTRELDTEFVNLQRQGQLALYPSARGQEGAQVGATAALRDDDWLFPQYRELGAFVTRGIEPGGVGAVWRGTWHGGYGFSEHCCAPISVPIGTQAPHAVGAAMAAAALGEDSVTVAFLGDGATSEGDVHEALNFAAVFDAPCLFFVQNNQWAISVPVAEQLRAPSIAHKAIGYGMPGVRVDGNDVLACWAVVTEAARRARAGEGPTLIEAVTYRLGAHTTSDDPSRYRSQQEEQQWQQLDPIDRYQRYLQQRNIWNSELEDHVAARGAELRTALRDAVVDARDPEPTEVFEHVCATTTPELQVQRAQLLAEQWARGAPR
jgi:pyruvate dehydrogenase E1 component alpha subunit